ncbi:ABC transporter permease [Paenibacillus sp. HJGM_3]|uniref:ABC transporter permease n=1 Tax=Paenibacillus sp. HJGM_3 TaxID=3379816 RepID=UPI00385D18B4
MASKLYRQRYLILMLAPAIIAVLIFEYIPLAGWLMAFKRYQVGLSIWDAQWVGLDNFKLFFVQSKDYIYVLRNTLSMNLMSIVVNLSLGLIFAVLLNEIRIRFFIKTVQTVSFFPFFISYVITYSIANSFLAQNSGILNQLMVKWGWLERGINFLGDPDYSWFLVIFLQAWKSIGYISIIFLAAISAIPTEQYEAADIDGASRLQKIRFITIPNLIPTLIVILIMNSGWVLNSNFELYFMFTNATNWERMEVLDMYIYKFGLKQLDYSYATAVGIMKTVVSIVLLLLTNALARKATGRSVF